MQNLKYKLYGPKTKAFLAFLEYILYEFNRINLFFQSDETRVHLLHSKSFEFLKLIGRHFLKPASLKTLIVDNIDFRNPELQKSIERIDCGPDCNDILEELSENLVKNELVISEIRQKCLHFYIEAATQILSRLHYIRDEFFINMSVIDARRAIIDSDRDSSFDEVCYYAIKTKLEDFDKAAMKSEWRLIYRNFSPKPELDMLSFDEMWKTILSTKDGKGEVKYPQLRTLVAYIGSLPHSNAAAERSFSMLPDICSKKRNRLSTDSINAIAVVKASANLLKKNPPPIEISDDQLSLMSSKNLYEPTKKKEKKTASQLHADSDEEVMQ